MAASTAHSRLEWAQRPTPAETVGSGGLCPLPHVRQAIGCLEPEMRCFEELKGGSMVTTLSRDPVISMSATLQLDGRSQVPQVESRGGGNRIVGGGRLVPAPQ